MHDALGHLVRLHLRLRIDVEDLKVILRGSRHGSLERDHLGRRVHERRVRGDGSLHGRHWLGHVDDDDGVGRTSLAHADELLRLHREVGEGDVLRIDAGGGELQKGKRRDGRFRIERTRKIWEGRNPLERRATSNAVTGLTETTSFTVTGGAAMVCVSGRT